uniref:ABC-type dipeptide/oligopeptide/nickel transport systems, permease components n=1 Tax=uncultured Chloroflexi bacterium HF0500_03M05 TaxID=710737 RepID=E0XY70_9CHLR|nr:ABC-type dipeptide/oligopeptide/nickel transport systems, permease components [uncultured Chloroflexi bacterium HF0500_03M05]
MLIYLIRRLLLAVLTLLVMSVLSFWILQIPPGDAVTSFVKELQVRNLPLSVEREAQLRKSFGLDQPVYIQYSKWFMRIVRGDPGRQYMARAAQEWERPVLDIWGERIWATVALMGFTILFTWTLAIPIGIYSAVRKHSVGDYAFTFLGFTGLAVPDFLLGLVLLYAAFAYFDQSVGGLFSTDFVEASWSWARIWDLIKHLWIPAIVLGTSGTASLIRIMRNNLLDELGKPYVVTARAKGMSPWKLILKYPVRVACNPLISTIGYLLPYLVGGSVIVSMVLSLPTLGPVLLLAINKQDINVGMFIMMSLGVLTVIGTLISDILLLVIDPRIKFSAR